VSGGKTKPADSAGSAQFAGCA